MERIENREERVRLWLWPWDKMLDHGQRAIYPWIAVEELVLAQPDVSRNAAPRRTRHARTRGCHRNATAPHRSAPPCRAASPAYEAMSSFLFR